MTRFVDGPAIGVELNLARVPVMLRVVFNAVSNSWDALDQPNDRAEWFEAIHVYRMVGQPMTGFVKYSGRDKHKSGAFAEARYEYLIPQPADDDVRTNRAWVEWCEENKVELMKGKR